MKKYNAVAIVLIALILVSLSTGVALAAKSKEVAPENKLREDYEAKKITTDEYIKYLAWATFKPDRLKGTPYAIFPEFKKQRKDATPVILEIKKHWKELSPRTKEELNFVFLRPTDAGGEVLSGVQHILPQLYETANFVFHYTNGSDGGDPKDAPDLRDANSNGVPDYIENFASYFEGTRSYEVDTLGYIPPPNDTVLPNDINNTNPNGKYDVFVLDLPAEFHSSSGELYGYTDPEQYPNTPSYSYIAVNKNYSWAMPNNDPEGSSAGAMKVTAAHEYFHAIQFAYDTTEDLWWMETSATYMEDEVYPQVNDNYYYLANWFTNSDGQGLETYDGIHEYGNFIWAKRLSEDFGDGIIKEIWVEDKNSNGLTAINNVLTKKSSSLVTEFNKFTTANYFLEDMYADGADYRSKLGATYFKGVWREYQYDQTVNGLPFIIDWTKVYWDAWMDKWAGDYITIKMNGSSPSFNIAFDGLDTTTNYDVSLVTKKAGIIKVTPFVLNRYKDGSVKLPYDPGYSDVVLIIRNSGNSITINPSWKVTISPAKVFPRR